MRKKEKKMIIRVKRYAQEMLIYSILLNVGRVILLQYSRYNKCTT